MKPFERSTQYIRSVVEGGLLPSATLAIGVGDDVLVRECFGNTSVLPDAEPVNPQTLYDMASVTKIMSTTLITLRLISRGVIDLVDMLPRYFGDLVPEDKKNITIYSLLTHTSGMPAHIMLRDFLQDPAETVPFLLKAQLNRPIGADVEYSCMGFILLGKLLEKVTGKGLDQLMQEEVCEPLALASTGYHPLDKPIDTSNTAYTERSSLDGSWLVGRVHDENAFFLNGVSGNAGVFSNLDDFIRYTRMLAGHGTLDGKVYLPRCIFDKAIVNYTPGMDEDRGLGFWISGGYYSMSGQFSDQQSFGHNGFTGPHVFVNPNTGMWVCMLSNRVHPNRYNNNHLRVRRILHTLMQVDYEELTR